MNSHRLFPCFKASSIKVKIILKLIEKNARLIDAYGLPLINVSRKLDQELISFRNVTNEVKRTEGEDAKFY